MSIERIFCQVVCVSCFLLFMPNQSFAADNLEAGSQQVTERKLELARKMHEIKSTKEQVDEAIEQVGQRLPEQYRKRFANAVRNSMNTEALEKKSIELMTEIFTVNELEIMVDYYSKPEAQSISEKMDKYYEGMTPDIAAMLDQALMEIRTGEAAE